MSEKPLNKKDDLQQDIGDAADNNEIVVDEIGDSVEPGPREMTNICSFFIQYILITPSISLSLYKQ